jgi:energy-coupling factor transporter ATP-binding protein EcfA2
MRIRSIATSNLPPVASFTVNDLSDLIVIAGPNGVGKSTLATGMLNSFHGFQGHTELILEATNENERENFGKNLLKLSDPTDFQLLANLLHQNRRRKNLTSSVIYFESSRALQTVQPLTYSFEQTDPDEELIGWNASLGGLAGRWTDTQHAIFKKIQSQRTSIGTRAQTLRSQGHSSMKLEFEDPLNMFREAFERLVGPKKLTKADLVNQRLMYEIDGQELPIDTLSSGEKEVVTICFDMILRKPSDCIIVFDEPEMHLHPELLTRMINTLKSVGERNQFIFFSHSPDLISSSLEDTVVFLTPKREDGSNQAVVVGRSDETARALHELGQSIGVLSLGRKIVIVEGNDSSLDRKTYSEILQNRFPELVLVPGGGRERIEGFQSTISHLLDKAVWGVSFFLYTDRDARHNAERSNNLGANARTLNRYHLENYFLDGAVLAECFNEMEDENSWLKDANEIDRKLREIAVEQLGYVTALTISKTLRQRYGNIDVMPSGSHEMALADLKVQFSLKRAGEEHRFQEVMGEIDVMNLLETTHAGFEAMTQNSCNDWSIHFPGKPIFGKFCGLANIQAGRLKSLYLKRSLAKPDGPFQEIISDFEYFSKL